MTDWPPRVLCTLYKNGLQTFYELLVDLIANSLRCTEDNSGRSGDNLLRETELRKEAEERLIGDEDPPDYLILLKKSYAVMSETAPKLGRVSFEQRWTQEQIVDRVVAQKFQHEDKPSHVLCSGYRKLRPSLGGSKGGGSKHRRSPHGLEFACENSSVDIVNCIEWKILLSRVGDLIMLHVLTHASVFFPLPNNCFLQVSGAPTRWKDLMRGKSSAVHPGEEMIGAVSRKKRMSKSHITHDEQMFKQAYAANSEFAGEKVKGVVRNQTSNSTDSSDLKRRRSQSPETVLIDVQEGCIKRCDRPGNKRQRCEFRSEECQKDELSKFETNDNSKNTVFNTVGNVSHDNVASCSNASSKTVIGAAGDMNVQCSVDNRALPDDGGNPHSNYLGKRQKRSEEIGEDKYSHQRKRRYKVPDQTPDFNVMEPQVLKDIKISGNNTEWSTQLDGGTSKEEIFPGHLSNHTLRDSSVAQNASTPQAHVSSSCTSGKRVRLPSWRRRKLRQAQESCQKSACTDLPPDKCEEGQLETPKQVSTSQLQKPVAKVEEIIRKEDRHSSSSGFHLNASDTTGFGCDFVSVETVTEKGFGSMAPKTKMKRQKIKAGVGTACGVPEKLVDRAPIFYNSNFACHPGLPAKHVLNTTKPNETGVALLFSAIFGARWNISLCSSPKDHTNVSYCRSKLKLRQSRPFKSIHKLLQELLSNAKRCKFGRLLGRHCPLPEGFHSDHKGSAPVSAPVPASKVEQNASELDKDMDQDEEQELLSPHPAPEVEDIMSIWLGPNYQPKTISSSIARQAEPNSVAVTEELKQGSAAEPSLEDNLRTDKNNHLELISSHTPHSKVVGFLWAVCRSIIPQDMLGCFRSWRALRSSIAHFVGLRRHEKFNVKHVLLKLPLLSFPWLAFECCQTNAIPQSSSRRVTDEEMSLQQGRLELWLHWLFTGLVVPLIRAHFYVTENENHRQTIFYYRKPVWARIRAIGVRELTNKSFQKVSKQSVAQGLKSRKLGFSQIRLLPKNTGLRPIANLAASSQGTLKFSIQTKRKATLRQMFGKVLKEVSSVDCSESDDRSLLVQISPPITQDKALCTVVEPCEASPSTDAEKVICSSADGCSDARSLAASGSSCFPSAGKISNVQKRSKKIVKFSFKSINSVLRDVHCCLKLEKDSHPEDLGSSVFGYCDIHRKVLPFIVELKESLNGMPRLSMAVCDVTKAYDTILQEKLQEIAERFVQNAHYKVARYSCVAPTLASVRVSNGRICTLADQAKRVFDSVLDCAIKRSHRIFVDQAFITDVRRDQILAMLGEHVKENIVQIGSHFYQQKVGIPQGSILSSLLCSLFYGHFDVHSLLPTVQSHATETLDRAPDLNPASCDSTGDSADRGPCLTSSIPKVVRSHECDIEHMLQLSLEMSDQGQNQLWGSPHHEGKETNSDDGPKNKAAKDSVLLRLIDDSLFISTSEEKAKTFVKSMHRGNKDYGCQANEKKTATSFCLQIGKEVLPRKVYKTEDGACFMRWSGLLINCFTLEFQADYTRYCGEHIRSALTVRREEKQGWHLVVKMCQYMRPKCHALFFDPRINSPATIRLNAFQAFLLCAMKFHAYICCLPHVTGRNEPFLYEAIDCAIRYMYGLLRQRMDSIGAQAGSYFPYKELEWLALVAFHRVLKRKQARYRILLHMLLTQLQMAKYNKLRACPHLSSATDERRSSMFKFIKY